MSKPTIKTALISGASIAGPTLAYWLSRYGIKPTVVERAKALRGGGYPIDIRATALGVVEKMGLLDQARSKHIHRGKMIFLDENYEELARITTDELIGSNESFDIELPRGDLAELLYSVTKDRVEYKFSNSIESLSEHANGVDVTFANGDKGAYDIVIGADGLHSRTRELTFGHESEFERYIGYCFAGFTVPQSFDAAGKGILGQTILFNEPGKMALVSTNGRGGATGMLTFTYPTSPFEVAITDHDQRELAARMFEGHGWLIPDLVEAMRKSDDLFFDSVSQIRMPGAWSKGRVVLSGDAAHATSFLSGQGSSMALISAYILAGELGTHSDYREAFDNYEKLARPFIEMNQDLVDTGTDIAIPKTAETLERRNEKMKKLFSGEDDGDEGPGPFVDYSHIFSALKLPDYSQAYVS